MSLEIVIDPNVRVEGDRTYAGFEDVVGGFISDLAPELHVTVVEEETDVIGKAVISSVDRDRQLVYLAVDWSSLHPRPTDRPVQRWVPLLRVNVVTSRGEEPLMANSSGEDLVLATG